MADELLDRVLREIRERKHEVAPAVEESRLLARALVALQADPRPGSSVAPTGSRPPRRSSVRRARAAPGANRQAILALVRERPGVTAGEIAQATGIPRSTVAPTLSRLTAAGAIERSELPAGGLGFRPGGAPAPAPEPAARASDNGVAEEVPANDRPGATVEWLR